MAEPPIEREPRNWFYILLNFASLLFVITALAYAVVPVLEERAREMGQDVPPFPLRDQLREHGWWWLLVEVAAVVFLALGAMGLDRLRRWQSERTAGQNTPAS